MADVYKHGVYVEELSTSLQPMIEVASPAVVFGTAPIHLAANPAINKPVLCTSLADFVATFGWSDDFEKYTLCEAAQVFFQLYNVQPLICVNVLDTAKHVEKSTSTAAGVSNPLTITAPIILSTLKVMTGELPKSEMIIGVMSTEPITIPATITGEFRLTSGNAVLILTEDYTVANGQVTLTAEGLAKINGGLTFTTISDTYAELISGADYTAEHDADGNILLTVLNQDKVVGDEITLSYEEVDASKVTAGDVIGGVDITTGANTGLELVEEIYPRLQLVPGTLLAPKFSSNAAVAAVLAAKADSINGVFKAIAVADLPADTIKNYTEATNVKADFAAENLIVCYPTISLGGVKYNLSTHLAALMGAVDADNDNIPYASPSNHGLKCDDAKIFLGKSKANYLNGQGIVTALNFANRWTAWGNRCSCYPHVADPKESFIPCRRMMNWILNTLVLSYWSRIDSPINRRFVEGLIDEANRWLNGLTAGGMILGGRIEFREDENPTTALADGKICFHMYIGFLTPAREINFRLEFDTSYFATLFS